MRIRVKVAVTRDGFWNAGGHGTADGPDESSGSFVVDGLPEHIGDNDYHIVSVEADVPLPSDAVVHGVVASVGDG